MSIREIRSSLPTDSYASGAAGGGGRRISSEQKDAIREELREFLDQIGSTISEVPGPGSEKLLATIRTRGGEFLDRIDRLEVLEEGERIIEEIKQECAQTLFRSPRRDEKDSVVTVFFKAIRTSPLESEVTTRVRKLFNEQQGNSSNRFFARISDLIEGDTNHSKKIDEKKLIGLKLTLLSGFVPLEEIKEMRLISRLVDKAAYSAVRIDALRKINLALEEIEKSASKGVEIAQNIPPVLAKLEDTLRDSGRMEREMIEAAAIEFRKELRGVLCSKDGFNKKFYRDCFSEYIVKQRSGDDVETEAIEEWLKLGTIFEEEFEEEERARIEARTVQRDGDIRVVNSQKLIFVCRRFCDWVIGLYQQSEEKREFQRVLKDSTQDYRDRILAAKSHSELFRQLPLFKTIFSELVLATRSSTKGIDGVYSECIRAICNKHHEYIFPYAAEVVHLIRSESQRAKAICIIIRGLFESSQFVETELLIEMVNSTLRDQKEKNKAIVYILVFDWAKNRNIERIVNIIDETGLSEESPSGILSVFQIIAKERFLGATHQFLEALLERLTGEDRYIAIQLFVDISAANPQPSDIPKIISYFDALPPGPYRNQLGEKICRLIMDRVRKLREFNLIKKQKDEVTVLLKLFNGVERGPAKDYIAPYLIYTMLIGCSQNGISDEEYRDLKEITGEVVQKELAEYLKGGIAIAVDPTHERYNIREVIAFVSGLDEGKKQEVSIQILRKLTPDQFISEWDIIEQLLGNIVDDDAKQMISSHIFESLYVSRFIPERRAIEVLLGNIHDRYGQVKVRGWMIEIMCQKPSFQNMSLATELYHQISELPEFTEEKETAYSLITNALKRVL